MYKEALVTTNSMKPRNWDQHSGTEPGSNDPRLNRDLDRKSKQILLEFEKDFCKDKSVAEIKEKIDDALSNMSPPLQGMLRFKRSINFEMAG